MAFDASPDFGVGGALHMTAADLVGLIPEEFQPEAFGDDAWDCAGDEELFMNIPDAEDEPDNAHVQCNAKWKELEAAELLLADCDDGTYEFGPDAPDSDYVVPEIGIEDANRKVTILDFQ